MGYDNLGSATLSKQNTPLDFEHALRAGSDKSQTAHSNTSAWSDVSASLTQDSVAGLRNKTAALPDSLDFGQPLNQSKDSAAIKSANVNPDDPRPRWLIQETDRCAVERKIEKDANLAAGAFGQFSACRFEPDELRKIPVPVDKNGDSLFGTKNVAAELPKVTEAMRKAIGNPQKSSEMFFDLLAQERAILTKKQFTQLIDGLNEKLVEWKPEARLLADGTYVKGDNTKGTSYYVDVNGSVRIKEWGPKPEDNWEQTRTADPDGRGGYEENVKTTDPKRQSYGLRVRSDYSYTYLDSTGRGQSRDAQGNIH